MWFEKQPEKIEVRNLDNAIGQPTNERRHGNLLPNTIRCIVCGPSNCGKTNLIISLLEDPNGLRFENVYVYSKSLYQPKYMYLQQVLEGLKYIGMGYHPFSDNEAVMEPEKAKPFSVMIFDDVACEKQDNMRAYFSMGRHNKIDSFYLCQTYSRIPKQMIRDNANLLILFRQDDTNLRHVYDDHVNTDMTWNQFRNACGACWKLGKNSFIVIDKDSELNDGRYRRGFDEFICM